MLEPALAGDTARRPTTALCQRADARGFWELRVEDQNSFARHRDYIAQNPVRKGLADTASEFPFCFNYLARRKASGAKAP